MIIFSIESEFAINFHTGLKTHIIYHPIIWNGHTVRSYDDQQILEKMETNVFQGESTTTFSKLSGSKMVLLQDQRIQHFCSQRSEPNFLFQILGSSPQL